MCVCVCVLLLQYVVERDADTLLPQFLSMYRVTLTDSETHLVVMRCVFSPHFSINCKYDLKANVAALCLQSLYLRTNTVVKHSVNFSCIVTAL